MTLVSKGKGQSLVSKGQVYDDRHRITITKSLQVAGQGGKRQFSANWTFSSP